MAVVDFTEGVGISHSRSRAVDRDNAGAGAELCRRPSLAAAGSGKLGRDRRPQRPAGACGYCRDAPPGTAPLSFGPSLPVRRDRGPWASSRRMASSGCPHRRPIVVLPFTNLSDDREQQYFADGITEDLTTDLSRLANMFVISRNTAFTYRNKPVDTKQIGRELCVRYVLEGSVRRSGNQLRVSAQLIDAATDAHLWTERFDRDTGDLFALQNEITSRIANALGVELIGREAARPTEHPDALDCPRDPGIGWWYLAIGTVHLQTRANEAILWLEKARSAVPAAPVFRSRVAAAYALRGETERAAAELAEARRLCGDDRYLSLARLMAVANFGVPKTRALYEATYFAGLR